ncbi:MAG TPA: nitroreductase family protein [Anaerolineales bacterium]|nr:nitroreductase family protein [Anaerolineales bacterium]
MDVAQAIHTKRAVRQFDASPLSEEHVHRILNAGRRAQSSKNTQPWHFIAIRDRSLLQGLSRLGTYASHLAGAALGVAILTPDPSERPSVLFDAGQAAAYMQLAAWELGVASCLATIYQPEPARHLLGFPADLHLRYAVSFGYPANPKELTEPPKTGGRRPLAEIVRFDRWSALTPEER